MLASLRPLREVGQPLGTRSSKPGPDPKRKLSFAPPKAATQR